MCARQNKFINHFKYGLAIILSIIYSNFSIGIAFDQSLSSGNVRVHYSEQNQSACTAILLGVGSAMQTRSYDKLSQRVIEKGHVFVVLDHAPGKMVKTDATQFKKLAEDIKDQLLGWIPDSGCNSVAHWIMGGHSAGGQAAQNAVANTPGLADALFSIDPYDAKKVDPVNVPAMYWGFKSTTCFVNVNSAAKEAYARSNDRRAFYKVNNEYSWGPCGYSPKYFHCSFCDGHCPGCTNCKETPDHFFDDVATSIDLFINNAFSSSWDKSKLTFNSTTPFELFVDSDEP